MPKLRFNPRDRTNPLIWCFSIICAVISAAVILAAIVVFLGYLIIKPKVPQISIERAQVDNLLFDQSGLLTLQVTIVLNSKNDNRKAHATFYNMDFALIFRDQTISILMAAPYDVRANQSSEILYTLPSTAIPLNAEEAEAVNLSLKQGMIDFRLKGKIRTRWRIWVLGSVKFQLDLNCPMHLPTDHSPIYNPPFCSSKSK